MISVFRANQRLKDILVDCTKQYTELPPTSPTLPVQPTPKLLLINFNGFWQTCPPSVKQLFDRDEGQVCQKLFHDSLSEQIMVNEQTPAFSVLAHCQSNRWPLRPVIRTLQALEHQFSLKALVARTAFPCTASLLLLYCFFCLVLLLFCAMPRGRRSQPRRGSPVPTPHVDLNTLTVYELRARCHDAGLPETGRKAALVARLSNANQPSRGTVNQETARTTPWR